MKLKRQHRYLLLALANLLYSFPTFSELLAVASTLPKVALSSVGSTVLYKSSTGIISVTTSPYSLAFPPVYAISNSSAGLKSFNISARLNSSGNVIDGIPGDDMILIGHVAIDGITYDGILLKGEVTAFGHRYNVASADLFDFTLDITGGLLAHYYASGKLYVDGVALGPSDFVGDFSMDFEASAGGGWQISGY